MQFFKARPNQWISALTLEQITVDDSRFLQYAPRPLFDGLVHTPERPRERPSKSSPDGRFARPVTMPPGAPDATPSPSPSELHIPPHLDHVVQFFKARPNEWISALTLEQVAGRLSWRTRVSECRTIAGLRIVNRVRRGKDPGAQACWCVSEYRYEP